MKLESKPKSKIIIVTATRHATDYHKAEVEAQLEAQSADRLNYRVIIAEGGAAGGDRLAREYAQAEGLLKLTFGAEWSKHGNRAGPIRNKQMIEWGVKMRKDGAEVVVLGFPADSNWQESRGTFGTLKLAREAGLTVVVNHLAEPPEIPTVILPDNGNGYDPERTVW